MKQPKLKIGDRVKIKKTGEEMIIEEKSVLYPKKHWFNMKYGHFNESKLQLIPNTKSKYRYSRNSIAKELYKSDDVHIQILAKDLLTKQNKTDKSAISQSREKALEEVNLDKKELPEKIDLEYMDEINKLVLAEKYNQLLDYLKDKE